MKAEEGARSTEYHNNSERPCVRHGDKSCHRRRTYEVQGTDVSSRQGSGKAISRY